MSLFIIAVILLNLGIVLYPARGGILGRVLAIYNILDFGQYLFVIGDNTNYRLLGPLGVLTYRSDRSDFPIAVTLVMLTLLAAGVLYTGRGKAVRLLEALRAITIPTWLVVFLLFVAYVSGFVLVLGTGVENIFSYSDYGTLKAGSGTGALSDFLRLIGFAFRTTVVILCAILYPKISGGRYWFLYVSALPMLIALAFGLAEASRITAVYAVVIAAGAFTSGRRVTAGWLLVVSVLFVMYSLEARQHRDLGLSKAPEFFVEMFQNPDAFIGAIENVSLRTVITNASINTSHPEAYSTRYKVLSYSPLPNAIDGFQNVKYNEEQRVFIWIPFSSFAEAVLFGPVYFLLFWAIVFYSAVSVNQVSRFGGVFFVVAMAVFALAMVSAAQYPIRNSIRFFYAVILFRYIIAWRFGKGETRRGPRRRLPAGLAASGPGPAPRGPQGRIRGAAVGRGRRRQALRPMRPPRGAAIT